MRHIADGPQHRWMMTIKLPQLYIERVLKDYSNSSRFSIIQSIHTAHRPLPQDVTPNISKGAAKSSADFDRELDEKNLWLGRGKHPEPG